MRERRGYRVTGQVQGIGYRHFTRARAMDLQLKGWICNHSDGSVEVHVEGAIATLDTFETLLKEGPAAGHVNDLQRIGPNPGDSLDEFEIRFG